MGERGRNCFLQFPAVSAAPNHLPCRSRTKSAKIFETLPFLPFSLSHLALPKLALIRKKMGGGETQGRGKHKAPPQKRFWTPPLMIRFPLSSRNVILLTGNGHKPDKSHFLRPPKLGLEGLYSTFSPPKNRTIRFAPPPLRIPNLKSSVPRCGSGPKCRLEGPPLHPPCALRTPPPAPARAALSRSIAKRARGVGGTGGG